MPNQTTIALHPKKISSFKKIGTLNITLFPTERNPSRLQVFNYFQGASTTSMTGCYSIDLLFF
jgi:hypothetical protein